MLTKTLKCSINVRQNRIQEEKGKQEDYFIMKRYNCTGNSNRNPHVANMSPELVNKDDMAQRKICRIYCPLK